MRQKENLSIFDEKSEQSVSTFVLVREWKEFGSNVRQETTEMLAMSLPVIS